MTFARTVCNIVILTYLFITSAGVRLFAKSSWTIFTKTSTIMEYYYEKNPLIFVVDYSRFSMAMGACRQGQEGTVVLPWNVESWHCHPSRPYIMRINTRIATLKFRQFSAVTEGLWRTSQDHTP